jgi:Predicted transmembrane transcriptional regulator (anti-sigma factor)
MKHLDGEITEDEEETLLRHIDGCEGCRLEFEAMNDTVSLLNDVALEEPPADIENVVISRLVKEKEVRKKHWIWALSAASIIAGWMGIIGLFQFTPAVGILFSCFRNLWYLMRSVLTLGWEMFSSLLTAAAKLLTVGRALGIAESAIVGAYSTMFVFLISLMFIVLALSGYMFKLIRRY